MRQLRWFLSLVSILLVGCQSTPVVNVDPSGAFHDHVFVNHAQYQIESPEEIFFLGEDAKAFVKSRFRRIDDPLEGITSLAKGIFNHTDLNLLYSNGANSVADVTFNTRAANCLSLTIMTYAMAKHAGLEASFQEIVIPEYWTRRGGFNLLNGHVNLKLYGKRKHGEVYRRKTGYEVDFDRRSQHSHFLAVIIDKENVVAMFYNNKGADALINKNYEKAYAYFKAALTMDPTLRSAWTNLGLTYRLSGSLEYAEQTYDQALYVDSDNITALENLAHLYNITQRDDEAESILQRIARKRLANPQYHFMLGENEFDNENWKSAISHYRHAIKLNRDKHEFYFGLAKSYYQLGDITNSQKYIRKAKRLAPDDHTKTRYVGKLETLSRL